MAGPVPVDAGQRHSRIILTPCCRSDDNLRDSTLRCIPRPHRTVGLDVDGAGEARDRRLARVGIDADDFDPVDADAAAPARLGGPRQQHVATCHARLVGDVRVDPGRDRPVRVRGQTEGGVGELRRREPSVLSRIEGVMRNRSTSTMPSLGEARKKFES